MNAFFLQEVWALRWKNGLQTGILKVSSEQVHLLSGFIFNIMQFRAQLPQVNCESYRRFWKSILKHYRSSTPHSNSCQISELYEQHTQLSVFNSNFQYCLLVGPGAVICVIWAEINWQFEKRAGKFSPTPSSFCKSLNSKMSSLLKEFYELPRWHTLPMPTVNSPNSVTTLMVTLYFPLLPIPVHGTFPWNTEGCLPTAMCFGICFLSMSLDFELLWLPPVGSRLARAEKELLSVFSTLLSETLVQFGEIWTSFLVDEFLGKVSS